MSLPEERPAWEFTPDWGAGPASATTSSTTTSTTPTSPTMSIPAPVIERVIDNADASEAKKFEKLTGTWPAKRYPAHYYGTDYAWARAEADDETAMRRLETLAGEALG